MTSTPLQWRGFHHSRGIWGCEVQGRVNGELFTLRKLMTKRDLKAGVLPYAIRDMERTLEHDPRVQYRFREPRIVISDAKVNEAFARTTGV
jgi:hypothetical protein